MLEMYSDHFGPAEADIPHAMEMSKDEKEAYVKDLKVQRDFIKKGYCRIQEKVKEIRQNFSTAVTNGKRSGSGKIVFEFYDRLAKIYGGSASASPLSIGVDTDTFSTINQEQCDEIGLTITDESHDGSDLSSNDSLDTSSGGVSLGDKRGAEDACVKLIDNKRKHMERTLSAAQRDRILLKESKHEMNFRKEMTDVVRESSRNATAAITHMSTAIENIGSGLTRSIEMLASVIANEQQQQYQHPRYQHPRYQHPQYQHSQYQQPQYHQRLSIPARQQMQNNSASSYNPDDPAV